MSRVARIDKEKLMVLLGAARQLKSAYTRIETLSNQHGFANPIQPDQQRLDEAISAGEVAIATATNDTGLKSFGG